MKIPVLLMSIINILFAYWWSDPVNIGIQGVDDINVQACREQVMGHTCLVWQSLINGHWEIYSRFGSGDNWLGDTTWSDTFRITENSVSDIYPSIAYDAQHVSYWCAWQNNSPGNWDIYIASGDTLNGWSSPYQITSDMLDDELPTIMAMHDTVWVAWQRENSIFSCYYDGSIWSVPAEVTSSGYHPKINRYNGHPIMVWDDSVFIFYSEFLGSGWQAPVQITFDYWHERPELAVFGDAWIVWQSHRDGNYEIYSACSDSFLIHQRVTDNDSADIEPSALAYVAIDRDRQVYDVPAVAFSTDRNGTFDIYNYWSWGGGYDTIVPVDTNIAEDRQPVMTGGGFSLWIIWQTDRNSDMDIYASTVCVNSIEESTNTIGKPGLDMKIAPNPFKYKTRIVVCPGDYMKGDNLKIFDPSGRLVRELTLSAGAIVWDGTDTYGEKLAPGVYFIKLNDDRRSAIHKIILIE
jgi:hypothetical protein